MIFSDPTGKKSSSSLNRDIKLQLAKAIANLAKHLRLFSRRQLSRLILILILFIFSFYTVAATCQPKFSIQMANRSNYYQGVYGFLNGFNGEDPIKSLNEMAKHNINLVILYGTYYRVTTTVPSEKDAILAKQFEKIDRYLAEAHRLGIQVMMPIWRMPQNMNQLPYMDAGQLDTAIRYIKRYRNNPTLIGWYIMDEPILRLESIKRKAPEYFDQYVIPAMDTLTEALDKYDTSNKIRFGVFERYNKGKYGLENKAKILIERYLTVWGHDQYPFIRKSPRELQNIYYVIRNFHALNNFVRQIQKPFLFVGQAQSSDANQNWQQRMPTEREFLVQQIYPMLLMSDEKPRYHLGNLSWAYGVMKSTAAGRQFLENIYGKNKKVIDLISAGIANGRIKDISQNRNKSTYEGEKAIKAGLYDIPQDSLMFRETKWYPHPFRGKKMAVALATRAGRSQYFYFSYPGKLTSFQIPFIVPNYICTVKDLQLQYDSAKQETLFKMQIMPLCPTVLMFDTDR